MKKIIGEQNVYNYLRRYRENHHCVFISTVTEEADPLTIELKGSKIQFITNYLLVYENHTDLRCKKKIEVQLEYEPKWQSGNDLNAYSYFAELEDFIKIHELEPREKSYPNIQIG
jgi:hypothetical protein